MKTVAIVGATGAVGREVLEIFEARKFPVKALVPFASARSEGKAVNFAGRSYPCQVMKPGAFRGCDIIFFDASDAVSKEWVPEALSSGAWVIDNSATFRMDPSVPLMVPEVNGHLLEKPLDRKLIAGPNCTAGPMCLPLKVIHDGWGIERLIISTYQSVSGAGTVAMEELTAQTRAVLAGETFQPKAFTHRIAFNCIPHIGGFKDDGYTSEEHKTIDESRKILGIPGLRATATTVRVPTYRSHAQALNIETKRPVDVAEVQKALGAFPGIRLMDDPKRNVYPLNEVFPGDAVESASGRDAVYVGRVRRDASVPNGLNMWVVSDNLRKGAALNGVQIAEELLRRKLV